MSEDCHDSNNSRTFIVDKEHLISEMKRRLDAAGCVNYLELVEQFHAAFNYMQPTPDKPQIENSELKYARLALLIEELKELDEAFKNYDTLEALDALCDLQYVLSGAILALGFAPVFDKAFRAVHENNMDKYWDANEVHDNPSCHYPYELQPNGKYIARRLSDGKIIKPPHHRKVDLTPFVCPTPTP